MRSARWQPYLLASALSVLVALAVVTRADGRNPQLVSERTAQTELRTVAHQIGKVRLATWSCQDSLGVARSKAENSIWSLPRSLAYRHWVSDLWQTRKISCLHRLEQRTIPSTTDWLTAVRLVQRIYPGTEGWLLFISHREGGWGRFVMNHQGSGAGGWLQFMSSTYYAYNDSAYADARRRGFIVDQATNSWTHPLGQALTGAYMRYTGRDGCHWCL